MSFSQLNAIISFDRILREISVKLKSLPHILLVIFALLCSAEPLLADTAIDKPALDSLKPAESKQSSQTANAGIRANSKSELKKQVEDRFKTLLSTIDSTLLAEHKILKSEQSQLIAFVDEKILPYWDIELTLRLLVGSKTWKSLKPDEIQKLKSAFITTMHRYVQEGINLYDGQRASFVEAELSSKGKANKGQITILLEPVYLPSFKIHFKVAKREQAWLLYDVFVEGISYVKLKKNEYRQMIHQKGVEGLLAHLESKNFDVVKPSKLTGKSIKES